MSVHREEDMSVSDVLTEALTAVRYATDSVDMQIALESPYLGLIQTLYKRLGATGKRAVAEAVRLGQPEGGYADKQALEAAFQAAAQEQVNREASAEAVRAVNEADTAERLVSALEAPYLGLVLVGFTALDAWEKSLVAKRVLELRPAGGYVSREAVQTALNERLTTR